MKIKKINAGEYKVEKNGRIYDLFKYGKYWLVMGLGISGAGETCTTKKAALDFIESL